MADSQLLNTIQAYINQRVSKETVYMQLLQQGITVDELNDAYAAVSTSAYSKDEAQKKTVQIVVTLGALLIGAGIFSFIAANWQDLGKTVKVGLILTAMLASYSTGWVLKEKHQFTRTGDAFYLLGSLIFGGGIFLVGQIFNIQGNWADAFILWMLGTLAMAIATEVYPLYYLAVLLGVIAIFGHPFLIFSNDIYYHTQTSSFLLILATIVLAALGFTMRKNLPPEIKQYY